MLILALGCRGTGYASQQQISYMTDTEQKALFTGEWMPGIYEYPFSMTCKHVKEFTGLYRSTRISFILCRKTLD